MTDSASQTPDTPVTVDPQSEGSITAALSAARRVYSGHPADPEAEGDDDNATGPAKGDDADQDAPKSGKKGEEPPAYKYKTHEDAEKGYREAERLAHQRAEEASRANAEAERLRQENEALKLQMGGDKTQDAAKPAASKEVKAKVKDALVAIRGLEQYDDDYDDKVAEIWANAGFGGQALPEGKTLEEMVNKAVADRLQAEKAAAAETSQKQAAVKQAVAQATALGLDMQEGSPDHTLFWDVSGRLPREIVDFDDQIAWVVKEVKQIKATILKSSASSRGRSATVVLERHGPGKARSEPPGAAAPLSLGEAISQTQRRV
jgi:hypothetical protein